MEPYFAFTVSYLHKITLSKFFIHTFLGVSHFKEIIHFSTCTGLMTVHKLILNNEVEELEGDRGLLKELFHPPVRQI
jgi:hypothetical protein